MLSRIRLTRNILDTNGKELSSVVGKIDAEYLMDWYFRR
jgi:hypothetical protein